MFTLFQTRDVIVDDDIKAQLEQQFKGQGGAAPEQNKEVRKGLVLCKSC